MPGYSGGFVSTDLTDMQFYRVDGLTSVVDKTMPRRMKRLPPSSRNATWHLEQRKLPSHLHTGEHSKVHQQQQEEWTPVTDMQMEVNNYAFQYRVVLDLASSHPRRT